MYGYEGGDECPCCEFGRIVGLADGTWVCTDCEREFDLVNNEWKEKTDD